MTAPQLTELVSHYFHEDYDLIAPTPDDCLRLFRTDNGEPDTLTAVEEFRFALQTLDESGLYDLWTRRLRSGFGPTKFGMTYREWFQHAIDVLSEAP